MLNWFEGKSAQIEGHFAHLYRIIHAGLSVCFKVSRICYLHVLMKF